MVFLAGERVGKGWAVAPAVRYIGTSFAELKVDKGYVAPLAQALQFRVVLPGLLQAHLMDPAEFDVAHLTAGDHHAVGTHSHLRENATARAEIAAVLDRFTLLTTRRFHFEPVPGLGKRTGIGSDAPVVALTEPEQGLHGT